MSTKTLTAAELGLSRRMQLLAGEPDGLVLVTGPRGSGKSTVLAALVEQITRTRSEHVIVVERRARVLHESRSAVLSQREVRGDTAELLAAVRAARREDPDVLVIDGLYTPELAAEALDAAASGSFVVVSVPAPSACRAIERLAAGAPKDRQAAARGQLADGLRGAVGQVLLRKAGGGVVAARELLLNNRLVADAVAEGAWDRLPLAMETGRRDGMVPLTDALLGFVRGGAVDVREAWRAAADREGLLAALKREGIDTSFAERLA